MLDDVRPFAGAETVRVVLPAGDDADVSGLRELIVRESAEFEAELGAPVTFRVSEHIGRSRPVEYPTVYVGPSSHNPELRSWRAARDRVGGDDGGSDGDGHHGHGGCDGDLPYVEIDRDVVVIDAPGGPADVPEAISLLRTAVRSRRMIAGDSPRARVDGRPAADAAEAVQRVVDEVAWTYPSFALRGIDWPELTSRWRARAEQSDADLGVLQQWIAELRDPHTSVQRSRPRGLLPYTAYVAVADRPDVPGPDAEPVVRLGHVPRWSAGWAAGARGGDTVRVVGDVLDAAGLLRTSAGETRTRGWYAGRRAMTVTPPGPVGVEVRTRGGRTVRWEEEAMPVPQHVPISWTRLSSGTGYLRIRGWQDAPSWSDAVDAAFAELDRCGRMIVDVRGNFGGNLVAALGFRDRFLDARTRLGSIRFSDGSGGLAAPAPIDGEPSDARRWRRPVRFLLDRLSYSATEDALLGLRDLDHVQFFGEPSGGGSGRPRSVRLMAGVRLSVSTALTFENSGRCVEGAGLAVDVELPRAVLGSGRAVEATDASWG
ncbi:S41 family peptidase [Phytoactinopolyspora halotolerans]|uniref:Tail specific protease domain-containing protein n=1 Tax=Phytoactinopolyspora halotolerans TaxID=1981512 RepID=A0A6L9SAW9_9ACTN|nr:S41 family peptidase [Phytoactinopolyspora halotolerans]NEE01764.1 hypothetical protein [Phytoactinopolyspora halotolerans]